MSGQAAIRGFAYQTIVSVIRSLNDSSWKFVKIEPDTPNDKVDILWEGENADVRCQQVKSSIRNFNKAGIKQWIEEMEKDMPTSISYELILIGNVATGTEQFIKETNSQPSVHIEVITFNLLFLESRVRDEVSRFLSAEGYHLPFATIYLIAQGLIYQFLQFSILGSKVSREELSEHLLKWVKFNYSKDLGSDIPRGEFAIKFYDKTSRSFSNHLSPAKLKLDDSIFLTDGLNNLVELYNAVVEIKLLPRAFESTQSTTSGLFSRFALPTTSYADVSLWEKKLIVDELKTLLQLDVPENFFDTGNLEYGLPLPIHMSTNYNGTDEEKKKRKLINELYWELHTIKDANKIISFFNEYYMADLVIENTGKSFDEEIVVNLRIPSEVFIFDAECVYLLNDIETLDKILEVDFLYTLFSLKRDSVIAAYNYEPLIDFDAAGNLNSMIPFLGGEQVKKHKQQRFLRQLENIFDFETYRYIDDFTQLRFHFKKINPNIKMAFPSTVLFLATQNFSIGYEITTKNNSTIHKGNLECIITK